MEDPKNVTITDSEWMVMRAIWTMGHATSRELIDAMNELEGWSAQQSKRYFTGRFKNRRLRSMAAVDHSRISRLLARRNQWRQRQMICLTICVRCGLVQHCRRYSVKGTLMGGYCELTGDSS